MPGLSDPLCVAGSIQLPGPIVMAALTRARADLIVTEANMIGVNGSREAAESEIDSKMSYREGAASRTDYPMSS
jgi:hypothetical protein